MRGWFLVAVAVFLLGLQVVGVGACLVEAAEGGCTDDAAAASRSCCSVCVCCPHPVPLAAAPALGRDVSTEPLPPSAEASVAEPDPAEILHVPRSAA